MKNIIFTIAIAAALVSCRNDQRPVAVAETSVPAPSPSPDQAGSQISGTILETMNAAGYTYVRVGTPAGDRWAAVQETKLDVGSTIAINSEMVARDFESKTLGRKFDAIAFGSIAGGAPGAQSAPQPVTAAAEHMTVSTPVEDIKVEKAQGGRTIAEVWAAKAALKGKPVVVRGKVIKFLPHIMGTNWIHLRDGSGRREDGTDDLTVTTESVAKAGDVVTVSGTLSVDKDFGSGYKYGLIVENAKVER